MRKLFVVFIALFAGSALADTVHLGTIDCCSGVGPCRSFNSMEQWALGEMSRKLKCDPNEGDCRARKGTPYVVIIDVEELETCQITHYRVEVKPSNAPVPNGHMLIWKTPLITQLNCQHNHSCPTPGGGGNDR